MQAAQTKIHFYKYQGTGNDFIILDHRAENGSLSAAQIRSMCDRRFGIGADGLMLLKEKEGFDFEMIYFNADGNPGSMCGNGGRCLVQFARRQGIQKEVYHFLASDGEHFARRCPDETISLKMQDVSEITTVSDAYILNTGSPHYVRLVSGLDSFAVFEEGKKIRNSASFQEQGINVNFVERTGPDTIFVRTYERGVEDETWSCGTGVTAAALAIKYDDKAGRYRIEVRTKGGQMAVEFEKTKDMKWSDIWLTGPAEFVFEGTIKGEVLHV